MFLFSLDVNGFCGDYCSQRKNTKQSEAHGGYQGSFSSTSSFCINTLWHSLKKSRGWFGSSTSLAASILSLSSLFFLAFILPFLHQHGRTTYSTDLVSLFTRDCIDGIHFFYGF